MTSGTLLHNLVLYLRITDTLLQCHKNTKCILVYITVTLEYTILGKLNRQAITPFA